MKVVFKGIKLKKLTLIFSFSTILFSTFISIHAKKNGLPTDALYIVPTPAESFAYSRFHINIVKPFQDHTTQAIAYEFPEILVGEPKRVIEFTRVNVNENNWISQEGVKAYCNVTGEVFNCNIDMLSVSQSAFSMDKALNHLKNLNLTTDEIQGYSGVIKNFYGNEPAGILSYEI